MKKLLLILALFPLMAFCHVDRSWKITDHELGYSVEFPATVLVYPGTENLVQPRPLEWKPARWKESTPFGEIIWFSRSINYKGNADQSYTVEVGTLPPGNQGGITQEQILVTLKEWVLKKYPGPTSDLDYDKGPGFNYFHKRRAGSITNGTVVFRRGRIHHARGIAPSPQDPQLINFLNSFLVDP
jgi:hypothetical protein